MSELPSSSGRSGPRVVRGRDSERTKEALLDSAEHLFAERGFEGTSMRAVTQAAGLSVSAANYHFGSKEAMLRATLERVLVPVNRQRLEALDALEVTAGEGEPPSLEAIMDTFLRPVVVGELASDASRGRFRGVAARLFTDPPELVSVMKRELFGPLVRRYVNAIDRALPGRERSEIGLAFEFAVAVMLHVISGQLTSSRMMAEFWTESEQDAHPTSTDAPMSERTSERMSDPMLSDEELLARMIRYAVAGLRAVPPSAVADLPEGGST